MLAHPLYHSLWCAAGEPAAFRGVSAVSAFQHAASLVPLEERYSPVVLGGGA